MPFRIGSLTKTFVATVALQLVAERKLRLGDSVERWVPGLVPNGRAITIRHLLSHTSGLYDYVNDPSVFAPYRESPGYVWTPRQLVAIAVRHPPAFSPGARAGYSSTNFVLLGLVIEAATGATLAEELRRRIFRPLDLVRTTFSPFRVRGPHVRGYRAPTRDGIIVGPGEDTSGTAASWMWGAGAIVSTAADLARFFESLLRGRLLPPRLLREMKALVPAGRLRFGLGLVVSRTPCGPAWGHTGNADGYVTVAWNTEDATRQTVMMVNTSPLPPTAETAFRRALTAGFCGSP
jgi:D-alanyl-D-alanine carboxypeptidase